MAQQLQPFILTLGFFVVMYFMLIRPQKKREKQVNQMRDNVKVGDDIITIGGIYGKVLKVKEDVLTIEVGSAKTRLDMTRWAVGSIVEKNISKNSSKKEDIKSEDEEK